DLTLALALAESAGARAVVARQASRLYAEASQKGLGTLDSSGLLRLLEPSGPRRSANRPAKVLARRSAPHLAMLPHHLAAEHRVSRPAPHGEARERREVLRRLEQLGRDDLLALGIEHDEVGVGADRDRALLRVEAEGARRVRARQLHDAREREPALGPLGDEVRVEERRAAEAGQRRPEVALLVLLGATRVIAYDRVDPPVE